MTNIDPATAREEAYTLDPAVFDRVADLALQGRTLMDVAGRPGGPWLGRLQKHLLESVIEDPALNTAAALEALARRWLEGPEGRT